MGMVQTWNQCNDMLLTSVDKRNAVLLMDTETGAMKSELSVKRQQRNWGLQVDSITPMQKFEQYKSTQEYQLYGIGDNGTTVFAMNHDSRMGERRPRRAALPSVAFRTRTRHPPTLPPTHARASHPQAKTWRRW